MEEDLNKIFDRIAKNISVLLASDVRTNKKIAADLGFFDTKLSVLMSNLRHGKKIFINDLIKISNYFNVDFSDLVKNSFIIDQDTNEICVQMSLQPSMNTLINPKKYTVFLKH